MSSGEKFVEEYQFWRDQCAVFAKLLHPKAKEIYQELHQRKTKARQNLRDYISGV